MRIFDQRFVDEASAIIRALPMDKKPQWGKMSVPQMFAHMTTAFGYALGKVPQTANEGGFFGKIAAPLILNGIVHIPKDQKAPSMYDAGAPTATAEELIAVITAYHARLSDPGFSPPSHPFFGDIGVNGWSKLGIVHFEHHLRQFGVAPANFVRG